MAVPLDAPMPAGLDLGPGFTLRVTALSTADGSVVSGVTVSNLAVLISDLGSTDVSQLAYGDWALLPGPGA